MLSVCIKVLQFKVKIDIYSALCIDLGLQSQMTTSFTVNPCLWLQVKWGQGHHSHWPAPRGWNSRVNRRSQTARCGALFSRDPVALSWTLQKQLWGGDLHWTRWNTEPVKLSPVKRPLFLLCCTADPCLSLASPLLLMRGRKSSWRLWRQVLSVITKTPSKNVG